MKFIKMHGLGNDYIYVNGFQEKVDDPAALAQKVADRHFGIGGDGLIMVLPPDVGVDADVRMRMFNADGSESEMCGNGIRCVCKLAYDHRVTNDIQNANPMKIQTGNGVLTLNFTLDTQKKVDQITVNMGKPILEPNKVPVDLPQLDQVVNYPIQPVIDWSKTGVGTDWIKASGLDQRMTCVSMGNPHVMFYCKDVQAVPLEAVGALIENHPLFPKRINAHFVQVHVANEVTMRTWERGSGITLACGTGASAVCVAGVLTGQSGRKILIHLPGGDLMLEWHEADGHIDMTGPATEVFQGVWNA